MHENPCRRDATYLRATYCIPVEIFLINDKKVHTAPENGRLRKCTDLCYDVSPFNATYCGNSHVHIASYNTRFCKHLRVRKERHLVSACF